MNRKRKTWALMLALVLCVNTAALATATPSKTIEDIVPAEVIELTTSKVVVGLSQAFIVYVTKPTSNWNTDLEAIADLVTNKKQAPIDYFTDKLSNVEAAKLPTINLQSFEMNEFIPISAVNYSTEYGDVTTSFKFLTPYTDGQTIFALASIYTMDINTDVWTTEWFVFPAVVSGGLVRVTFSSEYVLKLEKGHGSLAILSQPF